MLSPTAALRRWKPIGAIAICLLAVQLPGFADPAVNVATDLKEASAGTGSVVSSEGEWAWYFALAMREFDGDATLRIRLCAYDHSSCDEYSKGLSQDEYWTINPGNTAFISATVEDLGLVWLIIATEGPVVGPFCESLGARSPIAMAPLASFGIVPENTGPRLGKWRVNSGRNSGNNCALNGWDVGVIWGHT